MDRDDNSSRFLADDNRESDRIMVEIPSTSTSFSVERLPSALDPIGEIYLRGKVFRGISKRRMPWCVLISSWIVFGGPAFTLLAIAMNENYVLLMIIPFFIFFILVKGTIAKIHTTKEGRKRRV